jgi:hypothetical protein
MSSRVAQFLHLHHHHGAADPDAPRPPLGGARNEALGLILVLIILTLIAVAFFWQAARKGSVASPSAAALRSDEAALQLYDDLVSPPASSFSSVRESWLQTEGRVFRERPLERVALAELVRSHRAI